MGQNDVQHKNKVLMNINYKCQKGYCNHKQKPRKEAQTIYFTKEELVTIMNLTADNLVTLNAKEDSHGSGT